MSWVVGSYVGEFRNYLNKYINGYMYVNFEWYINSKKIINIKFSK